MPPSLSEVEQHLSQEAAEHLSSTVAREGSAHVTLGTQLRLQCNGAKEAVQYSS